MASIGISVTLNTAGPTVAAVNNPESANRTDTVTWTFNTESPMMVVFKKVVLPNGNSLLISGQGPFLMPLSVSIGQVSGTVAPDAPGGRYLYDIHDSNNQQVPWAPGLSPNQNFGGLDIPKP